MKYQDKITSDVPTICNLFAEYFQSVYSLDNPPSQKLPYISRVVNIGHLVFSPFEIEEVLSKLDVNKSEGPDGIPAILLRKCCIALAQPLSWIFNLSLAKGQFLDCWKVSYLSPIFKSGSKQDIINYRPICKLSCIPKVFEKLVCNRLTELFHNHISVFQHGFVSGKSTATNLALMSNNIITNMENGFQTDVIFTDFAKAFDRVNHQILLNKLSSLGIHSSLLKWLESYLSGRVQIVKVYSSLSKFISVPSGVPQGSHLGPLLFLLFVNDIPNVFQNSNCLLFADDLKLYRKVSCQSDCFLLLDDLLKLDYWCKKNHLLLNVSKCQVLSFFRNSYPIMFDYNINHKNLERVTRKKDLGVILDTNLSFLPHYDFIINKANQMLGFLKRNTKEFSDPYTLKSLYNSLVRSVLEYCSIVWNPYYKNSIDRIEKVQKNFTRYAFYKLNWSIPRPSYYSRCLLFGMHSLYDRRVYFSVMFMRDLVTFHINCPPLLTLVNCVNAPSRTTRYRFQFYEQFHRTNYGRNEPITRCTREVNLICNRIDFNLDISRDIFKNYLLNNIKTVNA